MSAFAHSLSDIVVTIKPRVFPERIPHRFSQYPVTLLTDQLDTYWFFSKNICTMMPVHRTHTSDEIKRMEHVPLEG